MKMITTTAAAIALAITATTAAGAGDLPTMTEFCAREGELAQIIMRNRQAGLPESRARGVIEGAYEDASYRALWLGAVAAAYAEPRWHTGPLQQRAAEDFRDQIERQCFARCEAGGALDAGSCMP